MFPAVSAQQPTYYTPSPATPTYGYPNWSGQQYSGDLGSGLQAVPAPGYVLHQTGGAPPPQQSVQRHGVYVQQQQPMAQVRNTTQPSAGFFTLTNGEVHTHTHTASILLSLLLLTNSELCCAGSTEQGPHVGHVSPDPGAVKTLPSSTLLSPHPPLLHTLCRRPATLRPGWVWGRGLVRVCPC